MKETHKWKYFLILLCIKSKSGSNFLFDRLGKRFSIIVLLNFILKKKSLYTKEKRLDTINQLYVYIYYFILGKNKILNFDDVIPIHLSVPCGCELVARGRTVRPFTQVSSWKSMQTFD